MLGRIVRVHFVAMAALVSAAYACGGEGFVSGDPNQLADAGGDAGSGDASPDSPSCPDNDKDGVTVCAGDCDDNDPLNFPGNPEICGDTKDNNCAGGADDGCGGRGTFVSGLVGNDNNPGTQAQPVKTINKGIQNAQAIGGARTVFVAGTHYPEKITLIEGVSLSGGYKCDTATTCTWARDVVTNDTAIDNQDFEGVLAGPTITAKTKLDGFRVRGRAFNGSGGSGPTTAGSACITIDQGAPTISNNKLEPGAVTNGGGGTNRTIGITIYSPIADPVGPIIDANTITGAQANEESTGIAFGRKPGGGAGATPALITANKITAGSSTFTFGIRGSVTTGNPPVVRNNDINGGVATSESWAIRIPSLMTVDSNRINVDQNNAGCSGGNWCGGIDAGGATTTIVNNVIFGARAGRSAAVRLRDFEAAIGSVTLNSNYLDGAGVANSANLGTSSALVLGALGGLNIFVGKVRNNIMMGGISFRRFGVYEDPDQVGDGRRVCHPETFSNNDLFFGSAITANDALYRFVAAGTTGPNTPGPVTLHTAIPSMESGVVLANNGRPANDLSVDPALDGTRHLIKSPASPCINKGVMTTGETPAKDFEGEARPMGGTPDIGHDEAQ